MIRLQLTPRFWKEETDMCKNKKVLALILSLAIVFVLLFSVFYIAKEAHHTCIGDNCPICQEIEVCLQALNNIGLALIIAVSALVISYCTINSFAALSNKNVFNTLVNLKVKLTN
jgi:hypothetical protein